MLFISTLIAQHFLPPPKPIMIGVDLGTTYSCVGIFQPGTGEVHILKNEEGKKTIPSIVGYVDSEQTLVGHAAERQIHTNPHHTIYDAKRFIGKTFSQDELDSMKDLYSFKMISKENNPYFHLTFTSGDVKYLSPEEIGAEILRALRFTAEKHLDTRIDKGVMSVPADFNSVQRNHSTIAANLAGLKISKVISEPTAAAMAYGLHQRAGSSYVMVVDIGGGTSDVSLLYASGPMFATIGMAGNNRLGGQDFNERLYQYVLTRARDEFNVNEGLLKDYDHQILRGACEQAKLTLSTETVTILNFKLQQNTDNPVEVTFSVTRAQFEEINKDLFDKVLEPVVAVLEYARLEPGIVDEIVLVGGSTRIPRIRELLSEYFGGKELNTAIDPELAVCTGVALQAGIQSHSWPLQVAALETQNNVRKISL